MQVLINAVLSDENCFTTVLWAFLLWFLPTQLTLIGIAWLMVFATESWIWVFSIHCSVFAYSICFLELGFAVQLLVFTSKITSRTEHESNIDPGSPVDQTKNGI